MPSSTNTTTPTKKLSDLLSELNCSQLPSDQATYCTKIQGKLTELNNEFIAERNDFINRSNNVARDTTHNLADKKTTVEIVNNQTSNLRKHIENIKQERMNKKRLVEASEWEYDRYSSHIYIFKFIFFSLVIINIILFIRKRVTVVSDAIYFGIIILITAFTLYNIVIEIYTNMRRDRFDYDKFTQTYDQRFNSNTDMGKHPKGKNGGGLFQSLMCESFTNAKEDTLNGHNYSFIN